MFQIKEIWPVLLPTSIQILDLKIKALTSDGEENTFVKLLLIIKCR